ncbi:conserved hypothetical protein [Ricinus communis]|uniref:Uncharacterized protein n=1 Tax=Ricinus communis TaxID=3988 RepID=B9STQ8_RICCO|nr:conserved hypothetical protein [Ricinus communis]
MMIDGYPVCKFFIALSLFPQAVSDCYMKSWIKGFQFNIISLPEWLLVLSLAQAFTNYG